MGCAVPRAPGAPAVVTLHTATRLLMCFLSETPQTPPVPSPGGFLRLYRFTNAGQTLELVHKTPVEGIPGALAPFKGRLLAGIGATLRLFDMGKKKLLRKTEYRKLPNHITTLHTLGDRIYAGDLQVRRAGDWKKLRIPRT